MKKALIYILTTAVMLTALAFAGCSGGSGETAVETAAETQAAQTQPSVTQPSETQTSETHAVPTVPETQPGATIIVGTLYKQITTDEAARLMENESDYIILDVRRQDEFDAGHIPGAICVPNEDIGTEPIPELPDKDQMILVYCRSGRRSKEAAQKLVDMGYTDIVEFGGIIDWNGEVITEQ